MARSLFFFLLNFLNDFDDVRKVLVIKGNFLFNIGLLYTTYVFKSFTQKVKLIFDIFFRHLNPQGVADFTESALLSGA